MPNKSHVWIIEERLMGCRNKWVPEVDTYRSKELAIEEKRILRKTNPGVEFRVRKYERVGT